MTSREYEELRSGLVDCVAGWAGTGETRKDYMYQCDLEAVKNKFADDPETCEVAIEILDELFGQIEDGVEVEGIW